MRYVLSTQNTIFSILQENPPLVFSDIYKQYLEKVGPEAVSRSAVRQALEKLIKLQLVKADTHYIQGKGRQYTLVGKKDTEYSYSVTTIQYGTESLEAEDFLKFLWNEREHTLINSRLWGGLRLGLIKLLLSCSEGAALDQQDFREKLNTYRNLLTEHLMEINSILNGDVWSKQKQQLILKAIGKEQANALLDYIQQLETQQIEELPGWE